MKNCYFWATPSDPINLIKAEDMPVYPRNCYGKPYCCPGERCKQLAYKEVLEAAKKSSVPIQDQERAKKLIGEQIASLNPWAVGPTFIQPGAIYGPFTVGYRIEFQWRPYDTQNWQSTNEHYWLTVGGSGNPCAEKRKVAILYDDTPEKDHDTVLKEFADKMSKQEDIPKNIQAVVNKRFWDMLDTPEKEESQEYSLQKEIDDAKEWELWRDFLYEVGRQRHLLHGEDFMSTRWEQMMDTLKKEFTITRKQ